jgi:ligand-binding SRPBCC domain-containing protein
MLSSTKRSLCLNEQRSMYRLIPGFEKYCSPLLTYPMTTIELQTAINAPIERCFDLSRSVELHQISTNHTNERAIEGRTSGLCSSGDTITWRARHFGLYQQLTVQITSCTFPTFFEDKMIRVAFKAFTHKHSFHNVGGKTIMHDFFKYEVPFGIMGRAFNSFILKKYMTELLIRRNQTIKESAESEKWKTLLS